MASIIPVAARAPNMDLALSAPRLSQWAVAFQGSCSLPFRRVHGGPITTHSPPRPAEHGAHGRALQLVAAAKGGKKTKPKGAGSRNADGEGDGAAAEPSTSGEAGSTKQGKAADGRVSFSGGKPVDGKLQVRIEVPGLTTQAIYDKCLRELAKSCPPVPGARKNKGGTTSKVEPAVVVRLVGQKRVTGFVVKELVDAHLATFVQENDLNAEKEAKTLQSAEELAAAFAPGQPFAFDAEIMLLDEPAKEDSAVPAVEVASS